MGELPTGAEEIPNLALSSWPGQTATQARSPRNRKPSLAAMRPTNLSDVKIAQI